MSEEKRQVANHLFSRGEVYVVLDARRDGVEVPQHLKGDCALKLQVGLGLHPPIHDLKCTEAGISGTLSFNRQPFHCTLPWDAIFALVDSKSYGKVWEDELPEEFRAKAEVIKRRAAFRVV